MLVPLAHKRGWHVRHDPVRVLYHWICSTTSFTNFGGTLIMINGNHDSSCRWSRCPTHLKNSRSGDYGCLNLIFMSLIVLLWCIKERSRCQKISTIAKGTRDLDLCAACNVKNKQQASEKIPYLHICTECDVSLQTTNAQTEIDHTKAREERVFLVQTTD